MPHPAGRQNCCRSFAYRDQGGYNPNDISTSRFRSVRFVFLLYCARHGKRPPRNRIGLPAPPAYWASAGILDIFDVYYTLDVR